MSQPVILPARMEVTRPSVVLALVLAAMSCAAFFLLPSGGGGASLRQPDAPVRSAAVDSAPAALSLTARLSQLLDLAEQLADARTQLAVSAAANERLRAAAAACDAPASEHSPSPLSPAVTTPQATPLLVPLPLLLVLPPLLLVLLTLPRALLPLLPALPVLPPTLPRRPLMLPRTP